MNNEKTRSQETQSFVDLVKSKMIEDLGQQDADFYEILPRYEMMVEKGWRMWRLEKGSKRYYFNPDTNELYPSVTSILWAELKESYFLKEWQYKMVLQNGSINAPREYMNERSYYGTMMHIVFTEALFADVFPSDSIGDIVTLYRDLNELYAVNVKPWIPELKSDVSAFYQWMKLVNLKIIAVEIPIYYPVIHNGKEIGMIGGTIDLVAEIDVRKDGGDVTDKTPENKKERAVVVVDYKSGKKGFYESHEIQVNSYMDGWNWIQNKFLDGKYEATRCYNFAPKDSRGAKPTFTFKEQTGAKSYKKFSYLYALFRLDGHHELQPIRLIEGDFKRGEWGHENVRLVDPIDYIKEQYEPENE